MHEPYFNLTFADCSSLIHTFADAHLKLYCTNALSYISMSGTVAVASLSEFYAGSLASKAMENQLLISVLIIVPSELEVRSWLLQDHSNDVQSGELHSM